MPPSPGHDGEFDSVVRIDAVREVDPADWGQALMEELLLKAAKQVAQDGTATDDVQIALTFRIAADIDERRLSISTPSEIETALVTRLPMDPANPVRS